MNKRITIRLNEQELHRYVTASWTITRFHRELPKRLSNIGDALKQIGRILGTWEISPQGIMSRTTKNPCHEFLLDPASESNMEVMIRLEKASKIVAPELVSGGLKVSLKSDYAKTFSDLRQNMVGGRKLTIVNAETGVLEEIVFSAPDKFYLESSWKRWLMKRKNETGNVRLVGDPFTHLNDIFSHVAQPTRIGRTSPIR